MSCSCFLFCFDHFHAFANGPHVLCLHPPLTEVLRVGPGPVLLFRHWPVAAWVAGATNVLHLPFLLHGLTDACDVTCKLRIGANCVWKERTDNCELLTPSAFFFQSPELNPFSQTVYHSRKITMAGSQWCTIGSGRNQKSLLHCKNSTRRQLNSAQTVNVQSQLRDLSDQAPSPV